MEKWREATLTAGGQRFTGPIVPEIRRIHPSYVRYISPPIQSVDTGKQIDMVKTLDLPFKNTMEKN